MGFVLGRGVAGQRGLDLLELTQHGLEAADAAGHQEADLGHGVGQLVGVGQDGVGDQDLLHAGDDLGLTVDAVFPGAAEDVGQSVAAAVIGPAGWPPTIVRHGVESSFRAIRPRLSPPLRHKEFDLNVQPSQLYVPHSGDTASGTVQSTLLSAAAGSYTPGMARPHDWQDCRPVLLQTWDGQTRAERAEAAHGQAALDQVWATLSAPEQRAFHDYCCHGARDAIAIGVLSKIRLMVETAMQVN